MALLRRKKFARSQGILDKYTERRLQDLRATIGCNLIAVASKSEFILATAASEESIVIVTDEFKMTPGELAKIPSGIKVKLSDINKLEQDLGTNSELDVHIISSQNGQNNDSLSILQCVLQGLSNLIPSVIQLNFLRWGGLTREWSNQSIERIEEKFLEFVTGLNISQKQHRCHRHFINLAKKLSHANSNIPFFAISTDGCKIIQKISISNSTTISPKDLISPDATMIAITETADQLDIVSMSSLLPSQSEVKHQCLIVFYSPKISQNNLNLREVG